MTETTTPETTTTITIPAWHFPIVAEKMTKVARRAKKLGKAAPTATVVERFTKMVRNKRTDTLREVPFVRVAVTGERPVVPGYTLIGAVTHVAKGVAVLRSAPGHELSEDYRDRGNLCEHCGTCRRRKETYVLRDEDGTEIQVGRNCLADFLADATAAGDLVSWWSALQEITTLGSSWDDDEMMGGYSPKLGTEIGHYLAFVAYAVRTHGWTSKGRAYETGDRSTAGFAMHLLHMPPNADERKDMPNNGWHTAEDCATAQEALAWIRELPEAERSSGYLANLWAACQADVVLPKLSGIVASLVGAAHPKAKAREEKRREAAKAQAERPPSKHVGEIKQRLVLDVTVTRVRGFEGHYGYTTILAMRDSEGNDLVWFASGDRHDDYAEGERMRIQGTVKAHKVGKYTKQPETVLTRCTVVERLEAAA